jgi:hypothetical protein
MKSRSEILVNVPSEFHDAIVEVAWRNTEDEAEALNNMEEIVGLLFPAMNEYFDRVYELGKNHEY